MKFRCNSRFELKAATEVDKRYKTYDLCFLNYRDGVKSFIKDAPTPEVYEKEFKKLNSNGISHTIIMSDKAKEIIYGNRNKV